MDKEEQVKSLTSKLKMNHILGIQSSIDKNQMKMMKDSKLDGESYMKNTTVTGV